MTPVGQCFKRKITHNKAALSLNRPPLAVEAAAALRLGAEKVHRSARQSSVAYLRLVPLQTS